MKKKDNFVKSPLQKYYERYQHLVCCIEKLRALSIILTYFNNTFLLLDSYRPPGGRTHNFEKQIYGIRF